MTAQEILVKHLAPMTDMIRRTMGRVVIDTDDLTRCIQLEIDSNPQHDPATPRGAAILSCQAASRYIERHHTELTELTIRTFAPAPFGHVTLAPGKWQLRRVGD